MPPHSGSVFIGRTTKVSREEFPHIRPSVELDEIDGDAMDIDTEEFEMATSDITPNIPEPPNAPRRHLPGRSGLLQPSSPAPSRPLQAREEPGPSPSPQRQLRPRTRAPGSALAKSKPQRKRNPNRVRFAAQVEEVDAEKEYEVEEIVDSCVEEGTLVQYYLVKWRGYPTSQNSWEPKKNLEKCREVIKDYERKASRKRMW